jgi:hypothetical protein
MFSLTYNAINLLQQRRYKLEKLLLPYWFRSEPGTLVARTDTISSYQCCPYKQHPSSTACLIVELKFVQAQQLKNSQTFKLLTGGKKKNETNLRPELLGMGPGHRFLTTASGHIRAIAVCQRWSPLKIPAHLILTLATGPH